MIEKFNPLSAKAALFSGKPKESAEAGEFLRNETVKGKVLRIIDQKTSVVLINGKEFNAKSGFALKKGDILDLKVKELTPVPVLKTLTTGNSGSEASGLSAILSILNEDLWESAYVKIDPGKYHGAMEKGDDRLSDAFENLRMMNSQVSEEGRDIFIPLPLRLPDGRFKVVQILLRFPRADEDSPGKIDGDKQQSRISLLFEPPELGPVRADFSVNGKKIEGIFYSSIVKTMETIKNAVPGFVDSLNAKGFAVKGIECLYEEPDILKRPLILEMVRISENSLDTVA